MNFTKLKEDIMAKLVLVAVLSLPVWGSSAVFTYLAVGENVEAITVNSKAINELTEAIGGMSQLFGNAEILENGSSLTAAINTSSNAVRFEEGQQLLVTNKTDQSRATITITVQGKFESGPFHLLDLSAASGRALRASEKTIQVVIEPVPEKKADD